MLDCAHGERTLLGHHQPTNLYSQELFPSLDYTLSFHIGLMARVQARRKGSKDDRVGDRLAAAFRRWEQAAEALDTSSESEEVQAVGMRCRECLITFARTAATPAMVPDGQGPPKAADVLHWSELIADTVASGSRAAEIRVPQGACARRLAARRMAHPRSQRNPL